MWGCDPAAVETGVILGEATGVVRDLVNTPGGELPPQALAAACRELGAAHGFEVRVLEREELERERFGGLLAVAAGSAEEPVLIELERGDRDRPHLALVGKGITFDAGGLSLKSPAGMRTMKGDMSGAAAIVGALVAADRLGLPSHVRAYLPCAENMPGGAALRVGDVVRHRNGLSTEVLDTDCEGRLVLADALAYAAEPRPAQLIDLATLSSYTGVGPELWAVLGTAPEICRRLRGSRRRLRRAGLGAAALGRLPAAPRLRASPTSSTTTRPAAPASAPSSPGSTCATSSPTPPGRTSTSGSPTCARRRARPGAPGRTGSAPAPSPATCRRPLPTAGILAARTRPRPKLRPPGRGGTDARCKYCASIRSDPKEERGLMKHWIRRGVAVLVVGVVVPTVAGCGSSGSSSGSGGGTPVSGGSLSLALAGDPGNLDPQRSVDGQNLLLSVFAYDTPVKMLNSGGIAPEVVTKWKPGKKSYVLTVGKGHHLRRRDADGRENRRRQHQLRRRRRQRLADDRRRRAGRRQGDRRRRRQHGDREARRRSALLHGEHRRAAADLLQGAGRPRLARQGQRRLRPLRPRRGEARGLLRIHPPQGLQVGPEGSDHRRRRDPGEADLQRGQQLHHDRQPAAQRPAQRRPGLRLRHQAARSRRPLLGRQQPDRQRARLPRGPGRVGRRPGSAESADLGPRPRSAGQDRHRRPRRRGRRPDRLAEDLHRQHDGRQRAGIRSRKPPKPPWKERTSRSCWSSRTPRPPTPPRPSTSPTSGRRRAST